MDVKYGDTLGTILLSYKNESGKLFEWKIVMQTRIEKGSQLHQLGPNNPTTRTKAQFPWWVWGVGGIVIIGAAGLLTVKMVKSKRQRDINERRL